MPISSRAPRRADVAFAPENILALDLFANRVESAGNDSASHEMPAIREDKPAQAWNAIVIIKDERRSRLQSYFTDFICSKFGPFRGS